MFSVEEKRHIAQVVEDTIRALNHPEMDSDNVKFVLQVYGRESWSWATIHENALPMKGEPNLWNEVARDVMASDSVSG